MSEQEDHEEEAYELLDWPLKPEEPRAPDNRDPHPVTITVYPREVLTGCRHLGGEEPHEHEAEYEFEIDHPASCSGYVEECPVADYLDVLGMDENVNAGFPEPDSLSDEDLAALNGTVRYLVVEREYHHYSGPEGEDWDVEYSFEWLDL